MVKKWPPRDHVVVPPVYYQARVHQPEKGWVDDFEVVDEDDQLMRRGERRGGVVWVMRRRLMMMMMTWLECPY